MAESFIEGEATKDCAMEYIGELREEQSYIIDSVRSSNDMKKAQRDANDIEKEISQIKKNLPFKMRMKIFKRTLSWRITKLLRLIWKYKKTGATVLGSIILASIGLLLNQLGVIAVVHNIKKAGATVKQYANDVHDMGKRIIQNVQALYRIPGRILGGFFIFLGIFLRLLYFFTRMSGTASAGLIFPILGGVIEVSLYFETNIETVNEKAADFLEETGNVIERTGIRAQKYISKNLPKWYWNKPKEERTLLQSIEVGATNAIYKIAQGTQTAGKKVEDFSQTMRETVLYIKLFFIFSLSLIVIVWVRNNLL